MDNVENKTSNKVLLTVIGAATFVIAMVGATFAYFSATQTSDTKTITTATTSLQVSDSTISVSNIRPTTWNASNKDSDSQILKTTVTVTGSTTANGRYSLYLDHTAITIGNITGDSGVVGDFKYAVYSGNNQIVAPTSFAAAAVTGTSGYLIPGHNIVGYTASYPTVTNGTAVQISDSYDVYIWIENANGDQNNLQEVSFDVSFTVDGISS